MILFISSSGVLTAVTGASAGRNQSPTLANNAKACERKVTGANTAGTDNYLKV